MSMYELGIVCRYVFLAFIAWRVYRRVRTGSWRTANGSKELREKERVEIQREREKWQQLHPNQV